MVKLQVGMRQPAWKARRVQTVTWLGIMLILATHDEVPLRNGVGGGVEPWPQYQR